MHEYLDLPGFHQTARGGCPDARLYCLADHGGMPGLRRELDRARVGWYSLFEGSTEENALEVAPLLFSLDEAVDARRFELLRWVAEQGTYASSLLLLATPLDLHELGARLTHRLDAALPDQIDVMLRFFDPRVFEALAATLDSAQKDAFLSPAECWWFVDRGGVLRAEPSHFSPADPFEAPLQLDARQEKALVAASEIDRVKTRLAEIMPAPFAALLPPEHHPFLSEQLDAARRLGVWSTHELALYCAAALLDGPAFTETPKWKRAIEGVRVGRLRFSDVIDEVGA